MGNIVSFLHLFSSIIEHERPQRNGPFNYPPNPKRLDGVSRFDFESTSSWSRGSVSVPRAREERNRYPKRYRTIIPHRKARLPSAIGTPSTPHIFLSSRLPDLPDSCAIVPIFVPVGNCYILHTLIHIKILWNIPSRISPKYIDTVTMK